MMVSAKFPLSLILCVLLICTNVYCEYHPLDISNGLKPFKQCLIHIITNEVTLQWDKNSTEAYQLMDTRNPVVLSNHKYHYTGDSSIKLKVKPGEVAPPCTTYKRNFIERDNRSFKFHAVPPPFHYCAVTIYIDLPICSGPIVVVKNQSEGTAPPPEFSYIFRHPRRPTQTLGGLRTLRAGIFFIRVKHYQLREDVRNDRMHFETWWRTPEDVQFYPTTVLYFLKKMKAFYSPEDAGTILTCPNIKAAYDYVNTNYLDMFFESMTGFNWHGKKIKKYFYPRRTYYLIDNVQSWQELDEMGYESCEDGSLLLMSFIFEELPLQNVQDTEYLLHWSRKVGSLAHIFSRILLGNISYIRGLAEFSKAGVAQVGAFRYALEYATFRDGKMCSKCNDSISGILMVTDFSNAESEFFYSSLHDRIDFVMCSFLDKRGILSLVGYISAFQWEVWLTLGITIVVGSIMLQTAKILYSDPNWKEKFWKKILQSLLGGLAFASNVLLAQGTNFLRQHRYLFGAAALGGVVLSNLYVGDNIEKLTANIPIKKIDTFEEIIEHNLTINSAVMQMENLANSYKVMDQARKAYGIGQSTKSGRPFEKRYQQTVFEAYEHLFTRGSKGNISINVNIGVSDTFQDVVKLSDPEYHLNITSRCGSDVYVDTHPNVMKVKVKLLNEIKKGNLRAGSNDIVTSSKVYGETYTSVGFSNLRLSTRKLVQRIYAFQQSGIGLVWQSWKARVEFWNYTLMEARNDDKNEFKPARLSGNMIVIFYVHLGCLAYASVGLLMECRGNIKQWILETPGKAQRSYRILKQAVRKNLRRKLICLRRTCVVIISIIVTVVFMIVPILCLQYM